MSAGADRIRLVRGDITRVPADAIVNAANPGLAPGGGVCGAIHRAGGLSMAEECRAVVAERGPVESGHAAITGGGALPARFVIHAVGPVWHGGLKSEAGTLASAYRTAIELADKAGAATVAFPSLSTGIYGYPVRLAAPVALVAVAEALEHATAVCEVMFVLLDDGTFAAYEAELADLLRAE